mmetsp:Transcript_2281/g.4353  ORF Transcript_2281/g.4353 Transcript_2281/m.4353 type:complete len:200 (-) Transcript_2281:596-1195(-)
MLSNTNLNDGVGTSCATEMRPKSSPELRGSRYDSLEIDPLVAVLAIVFLGSRRRMTTKAPRAKTAADTPPIKAALLSRSTSSSSSSTFRISSSALSLNRTVSVGRSLKLSALSKEIASRLPSSPLEPRSRTMPRAFPGCQSARSMTSCTILVRSGVSKNSFSTTGSISKATELLVRGWSKTTSELSKSSTEATLTARIS